MRDAHKSLNLENKSQNNLGRKKIGAKWCEKREGALHRSGQVVKSEKNRN